VDPAPPEGPVVDGVRLRVLSEDLHHPTAVAVVPGDSRIFVAQRQGTIRVIAEGELLAEPLLDLRSSVGQNGLEQGLLGLALHPEFASNGLFYVNYTALDNATHVARFRMSEDDAHRADPSTETLVLEVDQPGPLHNGGNLVFGPDGMLYIGMGDGDRPASAQDPSDLLGALLRIDVAGGSPYAIPPDNPYVGSEGRDEIWAIGLRNPWRFSFDPPADRLMVGDVGATLWEEIDAVPATSPGLNFGWPHMEGPLCTDASGCDDYVAPLLAYDHSDGSCAVVGGYVYRGDAFPDLDGHYFYGDNCRSEIFSFHPSNPDQIRTWDFGNGLGSIFSFGVDGDGELYVLTIDGAYRLEPAE
jgi:glucose/arabinose dehydrogenase